MALANHPFAYTATGILGEQRETMLDNELLLRRQLGRPMDRGYTNYPGYAGTYGRANVSVDGGVPEALRGWSSGVYFPKISEVKTERDFLSLNRCAVEAGLVTARDHKEFRAVNDIRRKVATDEIRRDADDKIRRMPSSFVYGVATRPSTPIHDLIEHKYQDKWLQEQYQAKLSCKVAAKAAKLKPGEVHETRASLLRSYNIPVAPAPLWKLPRFAVTAKPHLETFRTQRLRDTAFKHFQSDHISRKGVTGAGVYEQAKELQGTT